MSDFTNNLGISPQQREAMLGPGNLLLTACPGSGKTRSVAARVATLKRAGHDFALLSHTKVGAREIAAAVYRNHGVLVGPDSFVGTLHSFLSRYVLLPFGHLVTGASVAVEMDEESVRANEPAGLNSTDYRFSTNGVLECKRSNGDRSAAKMAAVRRYKARTAESGYVSYDDAMYWSYRVLSDRSEIAEAVVARFDEILVDEAQDSNAMQLACLRVLHDAGLDSLVLVGDFDQSIYGFGGATPALCRDLAVRAGLTEKRLTENYRSSQLICDVTARFRVAATPDLAVGPDRDYPVPPQVLIYSPSDLGSIKERFREIIAECPGEFESSVVVTRTNALANLIRGRRVGRVPELLGLLLRVKAMQPTLDDLRDLQRAMLRRAFGSPPPSGLPLDVRAVRSSIMASVAALPDLSGDLFAWAQASYTQFDALVASALPSTGPLSPLPIPSSLRGEAAEDFALDSFAEEFRVESVHGVKGESVDAVMVVAEAAAKPWFTPQADTWASGLAGGAAPRDEENRIFYVATTRARRLLVLALPDDTQTATVDEFQRAGFVLRV